MVGVSSKGIAVARSRLRRALDLIFAGAQSLDPRITFGRTTNAAVTGPDGTLQWAPHNLLTFSEQFDNAAWTKAAATVTANAAVAPDGTTTADLVTSTGADGYFGRGQSGVSGNQQFTASIYLRADAATTVRLYLLEAVGGSAVQFVTCNVTTEWQRFSVSFTTGAAVTAISTQVGGASSFGTGKAVYAWGYQLNIGALQPYNPTTVKNLLGFTQEFDNAAWTKSNSFVQTNFIRNNTGQGAVAGTPGTLPTNWSVSGTPAAGLTRTVVGTGIQDGVNYVDLRFQGTPSSGGLNIVFDTAPAIAATTGQQWSLSAYAAIVGGSTANLSSTTLRFDEGAPGYLRTASVANISTFTGNLVRYSGAATIGASTTQINSCYLQIVCAAAPIDFTIRIGLPQLVQGATAGDVVATYGTAAAVGYTAPDGSLTADKLVENTATTFHYVVPAASTPVVTGTTITTSVYAKADERTGLGLFPYSSAAGARFNLASGTIISQEAGVTASIVSVGNGWFRCSASIVAPGTSAAPWILALGPSNATNYAGNGTSGILIWGAQLSDSASLDPYVYQPVAAPASTAYYGPRFDYDPVTLAPRGLLIEEQRTNLSSNSVLASAWGAPSAASYTDTQALAPDGTNTAWRLTEDTTNAVHFGSMNSINIAYTSGTTYTVSRFLKAAGRTQVSVYLPGGAFASSGRVAVFDLSAGTVVSTEAGVTASIQNVGNGWYRCATTATANASVAAHVGGSALNGGAAYQGNGTSGVFVWGHQLEAGAFATSYIPTTTAAATRAADVATMIGANFSSWYRQDEGTLFAEAALNVTTGDATTRIVFGTSAGTFNESVYVSRNSNSALLTASVISGGTAQASMQPATAAVAALPFKTALSLQANNFSFCMNGGSVIVDTSGTLPAQTGLSMGNANWSGGVNWLNGHIRRVAFFQRRFSLDETRNITA